MKASIIMIMIIIMGVESMIMMLRWEWKWGRLYVLIMKMITSSVTLHQVFSTFVVCWAPFFILNLVASLCSGGGICSLPTFMFEMALWLGQ